MRLTTSLNFLLAPLCGAQMSSLNSLVGARRRYLYESEDLRTLC